MMFLVVTGMSGAGKSTVLNVLEDTGFFCIDNMPPELIPKFAELCSSSNTEVEKVSSNRGCRSDQTVQGDAAAASPVG